jgi:hypothetical protein
MSVSFHLVYSFRWQDSHAADPTNVLAAAVMGSCGDGDDVHAVVSAPRTSTMKAFLLM